MVRKVAFEISDNSIQASSSYAGPSVHLFVRRGIITLLDKIGKDSRYLANWTPLTLLNTDYKILATRLNIVLPRIINPMQSGFIKNRNMADVLSLVNAMDHCNKNKISAVILSFDFEKAFNTVEWPAITKILKRLNFGNFFVNAINTLYNNARSTVINNGY